MAVPSRHSEGVVESDSLLHALFTQAPRAALATPTGTSTVVRREAANGADFQVIALTTTIPIFIFPSGSAFRPPGYYNLDDGSLVTDSLSSGVHRASADLIITSMVLI